MKINLYKISSKRIVSILFFMFGWVGTWFIFYKFNPYSLAVYIVMCCSIIIFAYIFGLIGFVLTDDRGISYNFKKFAWERVESLEIDFGNREKSCNPKAFLCVTKDYFTLIPEINFYSDTVQNFNSLIREIIRKAGLVKISETKWAKNNSKDKKIKVKEKEKISL